MTKCERFEQCISFFEEQSKKLPATSHFMESTYCLTGNHHCARFVFFMARGEDDIPLDLFPCQHIRGEILSNESHLVY